MKTAKAKVSETSQGVKKRIVLFNDRDWANVCEAADKARQKRSEWVRMACELKLKIDSGRDW